MSAQDLAGGNGFDTAAALRKAAEHARAGHVFPIAMLRDTDDLSDCEIDLVMEAEARLGGPPRLGPGWATARAETLDRAARLLGLNPPARATGALPGGSEVKP